MLELLGAGLLDVAQTKYLLPLFFGTLAGVVGGALPGVTITMTIIVVLPFTFGLANTVVTIVKSGSTQQCRRILWLNFEGFAVAIQSLSVVALVLVKCTVHYIQFGANRRFHSQIGWIARIGSSSKRRSNGGLGFSVRGRYRTTHCRELTLNCLCR